MVWGAVSLIGLLVVALIGAYSMRNFGVTESDKTDKASKEDVRFILNWCRIGDSRTDEVLHSYESSRSFTGDHVDLYAIKVRDLSIVDLKAPSSDADGGWLRCDKLSPVFVDAVRLVSGFSRSDDRLWFPEEADLLSGKYYIWVWSVYLHGQRASSAQIIFANPETSTLYYSSVKT